MPCANVLCLQVLELAVDVETVLERRHGGGCYRNTSRTSTCTCVTGEYLQCTVQFVCGSTTIRFLHAARPNWQHTCSVTMICSKSCQLSWQRLYKALAVLGIGEIGWTPLDRGKPSGLTITLQDRAASRARYCLTLIR